VSARLQHQYIKANDHLFHVAVSEPADNLPASQQTPPLFCVHGFPEGWMSWQLLMEHLPNTKIYAPDLRGYPGSDSPPQGYDVFALLEDLAQLIQQLGLVKPIMVTHDWGGALGWMFAHQYGHLIEKLVVVNCTHPRTLVRAVLHAEDWQPFRIPWVPVFQIPLLPELLLTTKLGRAFLKLSFTLREGRKDTMNRDVVNSIVERFQHHQDLRGPINYYRDIVKTILWPPLRARLEKIYSQPIQIPVTLIWGEKDEALSSKVAQKSHLDAGCDVEWRLLPGVGHFVDLEAPELLAAEIKRLF
jgi:hypothetical protein